MKKQENISITTMKLMLQNKWVKVFKNGPSKMFGRESLKNLKWYDLLRKTLSFQIF